MAAIPPQGGSLSARSLLRESARLAVPAMAARREGNFSMNRAQRIPDCPTLPFSAKGLLMIGRFTVTSHQETLRDDGIQCRAQRRKTGLPLCADACQRISAAATITAECECCDSERLRRRPIPGTAHGWRLLPEPKAMRPSAPFLSPNCAPGQALPTGGTRITRPAAIRIYVRHSVVYGRS